MDWYQCRRQKKFSEDQNILAGDAAVTYNSAFLHQIHSTHFCPESCIKIWNQCCSLFYSNNFATTKQPSSSWEICTCCKRNVSLEIIKILQKTLHEIFARMGPSTRLSAFLLNSCSKATCTSWALRECVISRRHGALMVDLLRGPLRFNGREFTGPLQCANTKEICDNVRVSLEKQNVLPIFYIDEFSQRRFTSHRRWNQLNSCVTSRKHWNV